MLTLNDFKIYDIQKTLKEIKIVYVRTKCILIEIILYILYLMAQEWIRLPGQFPGLWPLWLGYGQDGQPSARMLEKKQVKLR